MTLADAMSLLPLTPSFGHWLSVAQKILSVGQPGFLGRVLKQPFFLFSLSISSSTKPLPMPVLSSAPLLCWDKGVAREAQLPVASHTAPSTLCRKSSALPLLTGTSPLAPRTLLHGSIFPVPKGNQKANPKRERRCCKAALCPHGDVPAMPRLTDESPRWVPGQRTSKA